MDETSSWTLKKNGELDRMNDASCIIIDAMRKVSILHQPLIPNSASMMMAL